jgi:acyl-CoA thioesterase-1
MPWVGLALLVGTACRSEPPREAAAVAEAPAKTPSETPVASRAPASVDHARLEDSPPGAGSLLSSLITPNPLVSRGKPAFGFSPKEWAKPGAVDDGVYLQHKGTWFGGMPTAATPSWVAIDVGRGPSRVYLAWTASADTNYDGTMYGAPGAYHLDVSADSTHGDDGTWKRVATVTDNHVRTRGHSFDFSGQRWVKIVITSPPGVSPNGVSFDEIDVHDVSAGASDTWFFFGDSITAKAFDRKTPERQPSFAEQIHQKHPRYFPAMINGGVGGEWSKGGAKRIDECLRQNPDARFWAIGYGTNDASGNRSDTKEFASNMRDIIQRVKDAGRVPIVAKIPYSTDGSHQNVPAYNAVIDQLTIESHLTPGPDLYSWFVAHPDQLLDGVHPNDPGSIAMNRLWAEAVDRLYGP